MSKIEVKYRRPLNDEQLELLRLLYCYRFGTCKYIAQYLGKENIKVVQKKLKVLEEQSLISKRYEKAYKLQGRPAEYYLTPKGARLLLRCTDPEADEVDRITEQGIKRLYKNSSVSLSYVAHCLQILNVSLHLNKLYGYRLGFITNMQQIPFEFLPTWRPDGIINLETGSVADEEIRQFFIDIWDGTRPFFVSVRKARSYLTYSAKGDWSDDEGDLPVILMICETPLNERKLRRQIRKALARSYEEVLYATTTMDALAGSEKGKDDVWRMTDDDDETLWLNDIPISP